MDWKRWLGYNLYKKLWSLIGGRPWTYISRDIYHKVEYLILVSLFTGGYFVGWSDRVSWKWFLVVMAAYTIGFIHGHFFWGKEYIPDQKGEGDPTCPKCDLPMKVVYKTKEGFTLYKCRKCNYLEGENEGAK